MKKYFITLALLCFTLISSGQRHEIGFFAGGTNYIGDVGKTNYILPNNIGGGLIYKFNLNERIALRGNYNHFLIEANDINSGNAIREERGYRYRNNIDELALGFEYNFFKYNLASRKYLSTPYLMFQVAGFYYDGPKSYNTQTQEFSFAKKSNISIPFGIGYKTLVSGKMAFAIETSFRYTFTDELDFPQKGNFDNNFYGNGNDWYVFTGISLVYTFGNSDCFDEF